MKRLWLGATAAAMVMALISCGKAESYSTEDLSYSSEQDDDTTAAFDEDAARADAEQEVAGDGYSGPCTSNCSGHDAGFAWAAEGHEDGGISSSPSFDEGQEAYEQAVEERLEEKRLEFKDEGSTDYAQ